MLPSLAKDFPLKTVIAKQMTTATITLKENRKKYVKHTIFLLINKIFMHKQNIP